VRVARSSNAEADQDRAACNILAALVDGEIAAVTAVVPSCGEVPPPAGPDGRLFALPRETVARGYVSGAPGTTAGPLPVVSSDPNRYPSHLARPTAFRWLMGHGRQPGSSWINDAPRGVPGTPAPLSPGIAAPHVRIWVPATYDTSPHGGGGAYRSRA